MVRTYHLGQKTVQANKENILKNFYKFFSMLKKKVCIAEQQVRNIKYIKKRKKMINNTPCFKPRNQYDH